MKIWKLIIVIALFWILAIEVVIPKLVESLIHDIEPLIEREFDKQVSELMRDEIIRQLKEKEGKTIQDYYIEDFFRRLK